MLNMNEFVTYVKKSVKDYLPKTYADAEVVVKETEKNNGLKLTGLTVKPANMAVAPNIYLEGYYKQYEEGADLYSIMETIANLVVNNEKPELNDVATMFQDVDYVKNHVVAAIINTKRNESLLENVPHTDMKDLSIIYKVLVRKESDGVMTITIRNEHMPMWGMTQEELHDAAMKNMAEQMPVTVRTMTEVLKEMMSYIPSEQLDLMFPEDSPENMMYVISNESRTHGAINGFSKDVLSELAEKVDSDLFILPSSIHEVIAISAKDKDPEDMTAMVQEVNAREVAPEEQLSDHVYLFDAVTKEIRMAS